MEKQLKWTRFGSVKPQGWLYDKMKQDLCEGYVGQLDVLLPELLVEDDIYGAARLSRHVKNKEVGNIKGTATITEEVEEEEVVKECDAQYLWWNSETQSNWWDGLIRHALLLEDELYLEKVRTYVNRILSTQDSDGYLGIYDEDLRFNFNGENGELWAQSSLFRGLLAYYEATGEEKVLDSVKRAVAVTMTAYPKEQSSPFKAIDGFSGLTHGLTFTDTLEKLTQLTGDETYLEYAIWLFEDYNANELCEEDVQTKNLLNEAYRFKGHGVHTYEHLRALTIAAFGSKNPLYQEALTAYLKKLSTCVCPSGGPIGDEWVAKTFAQAGMTGYEYCSIHELLHAYSLLLERTNDFSYADRLEWLYYNAALGAMHPTQASIAYLKSDNSYAMEGEFHTHQPHSVHQVQTRYKYSPVHQDAAVCCIPNAGRITPYFLGSMYFEGEAGVTVALYGPSVYEANGVKLTQRTTYPSDYVVNFELEVAHPSEFELCLRIPKWAKEVQVDGISEGIEKGEDCLVMKQMWTNRTTFTVTFIPSTQVHTDLVGDVYFSYGPLVYAKEIQGEEIITKTYVLPGFKDVHVKPIEEIPSFIVSKSANVEVLESGDEGRIKAPHLRVEMMNHQTLIPEQVVLKPMANCVLRRVTFSSIN